MTYTKMAKIVEINEIKNTMTSSKKFSPGDFVTFSNKKGAFAIYEGVDTSTSTYKKLTVILAYDPSKYTKTEDGYQMIPFMEVSSKNSPCEKTLDTDEDSYWTRRCTEEEIEKALEVMRNYGYLWDKENLAVVSIDSGEVIAKVHLPKVEYKGQIIKPMTEKFKKMLRMFCLEKNKKVEHSYPSNYSRYWDMLGESYYNDYWD